MESFALSFFSMLLALAVVLVLAWLALRVLRARMSSRSPARAGERDALRFVRSISVGARERVVIVEHRGERWMLGVTAGGISTIAHWKREEMPPEAPAAPTTSGEVEGRP